MSDEQQSEVLIEIVESFLSRQRRGERPSLAEYVARHPDLRDDIQDMLPALEILEELASDTCAPPRVGPEPPSRRPTRLGDYRLLRELGRGGMGIVYEAVQESLGRHVAVKILPDRYHGKTVMAERFRREAQAAARLHHPRIVPVFGSGEDGDIAYYAMQYIEGRTLETVCHQRRRNPPDDTAEGDPPPGVATGRLGDSPSTVANRQYFRWVAEIGVQVASALQYAHEQGVVHRDVKPGNLILDADGAVWITDFGLAKSEGSDELTCSGDVLGTLRYMAPEQLTGEVDARTDVYGLGLTLYELATHLPAFDDPVRWKLLEKIRSAEPQRPSRIQPRVPRDLETIILKAIAKEPADRYASAGAMADDLQAFLEDRPIRVRRASVRERTVRWCRRNRLVAGLAAAVFSLLVVALVAALWTASVLRQQRNEAYLAQETARQRLWQATLNEARSVTYTRQPGQRTRAIELVTEALGIFGPEQLTAADLVDVRSVAASAMLLTDISTQREWPAHGAAIDGWFQTFDFDEGISKYAARLQGGRISLRSVVDDRELLRFPTINRSPTVCLSSSGKRLAISDRVSTFERTEIWDVTQQPPRLLHRAIGACGKYVDFAPDDNCAAYFRLNSGLEWVDLTTREVRQHALPGDDPWRVLAFDPAGDRIAYADGKTLRIVDARANREVAAVEMEAKIYSLNWHPSGQSVAAGLDSKQIDLVDVERQRTNATFAGHVNLGITVRFNHRGDRLISNDWSNRTRIWDVGSQQQLLSFPSQGRTFRVSQDDSTLAAQAEVPGGGLRLVQLISGSESATVRQANGEKLDWSAVAISPVDRIACFNVVAPHRGLALVGLDDGVVLAAIEHAAGTPVRFLADGSLVSLGNNGVHHWTRTLDDATGQVSFGPPVRIGAKSPLKLADSSADGATLAVPSGTNELLILRRGLADLRVDVGAGTSGQVAVSPDGRLVAVSTVLQDPDSDNLRVYDAQSGALVAKLAASKNCLLDFSPDGQWLSARLDSTINSCRVWKVGEWETTRMLDAIGVVFGTQSPLAATSSATGVIRIFDFAKDRDIVRLTFPDEESVFALGFSGDDSTLLIGSERSRAARLIDLRAIRRQLAELGLDWEQPPLRGEPEHARTYAWRPLTVEDSPPAPVPPPSP